MFVLSEGMKFQDLPDNIEKAGRNAMTRNGSGPCWHPGSQGAEPSVASSRGHIKYHAQLGALIPTRGKPRIGTHSRLSGIFYLLSTKQYLSQVFAHFDGAIETHTPGVVDNTSDRQQRCGPRQSRDDACQEVRKTDGSEESFGEKVCITAETQCKTYSLIKLWKVFIVQLDKSKFI